jgi:hypothetical protein
VAQIAEKEKKKQITQVAGKYDENFRPAKKDKDAKYECIYLEDADGKQAWGFVIRPEKEEKSL